MDATHLCRKQKRKRTGQASPNCLLRRAQPIARCMNEPAWHALHEGRLRGAGETKLSRSRNRFYTVVSTRVGASEARASCWRNRACRHCPYGYEAVPNRRLWGLQSWQTCGNRRKQGGQAPLKTRASVWPFEAKKAASKSSSLTLKAEGLAKCWWKSLGGPAFSHYRMPITLDGFDSEGIFPSVWGMKGSGIVARWAQATSVKTRRSCQIPLYHGRNARPVQIVPQRQDQTLCTAIRGHARGKGADARWPPRGFSYKGQPSLHLQLGCSTFSKLHRPGPKIARRRKIRGGRAVPVRLLHRAAGSHRRGRCPQTPPRCKVGDNGRGVRPRRENRPQLHCRRAAG